LTKLGLYKKNEEGHHTLLTYNTHNPIDIISPQE